MSNTNITLSVDDEIVKQAKLRAVQDGTSLSAKMRQFLQRYAAGMDVDAAPDMSFADNARLFARNRASTPLRAAEAPPPAGLAGGASVDADYLRSLRGWAREDAYDHPTRHGARPAKPE